MLQLIFHISNKNLHLHPIFSTASLFSPFFYYSNEFSEFHVKVRVLGLGLVIASAMASLVTKGPGAFWCASSRL